MPDVKDSSRDINYVKIFCRQVRSRSEEHCRALEVVNANKIYTIVGTILRQELDSLVRVVYLLSIQDIETRLRLIRDSVEGRVWRNSNGGRITDREMVELSNSLHGWTKSVYMFGCSFIHLSSFHDYTTRDPFRNLSFEEKQSIIQHIKYYHGGPINDDPSFNDIIPYLWPAFNKVRGNLGYYLEKLERSYDKKTNIKAL